MWVKSLELKNFQAHKCTIIDFNNQFNCIVGPSRAGKSSVVRALNFLFFDIWSDSYVRNGCAYTELTLLLDNNYKIVRMKGDQVNKIIVTAPDGSQQLYEKFGSDTPDPVRKILQIYPVQIDVDADAEINIADQDHPNFLLGESGPTKTKYINRLTGSHVLDAAMRSVNKDKSSILTEKSLISDNVTDLSVKLKRFENAPAVKVKLEQYYSDCKRIHKQVTLLRKVEVAGQDLERFTLRLSEIASLECKTEELLLQLNETVAVAENLKLLQQLQETCRIEQEITNAIVKAAGDEAVLMDGIKQCPLCGTVLNS